MNNLLAQTIKCSEVFHMWKGKEEQASMKLFIFKD